MHFKDKYSEFLIIGSTSPLASAFCQLLSTKDLSVYRTSRYRNFTDYHLDLTEETHNIPISKGAGIAVIFAGYNNIKMCREDPQKSFFVNVTQTIKLINDLSVRGWIVVYLSSTLVFDGKNSFCKPDESRNPASTLGLHKKIVEDYILNNLKSAYIIRITKLLKFSLDPFSVWVKQLSNNRQIEIYNGAQISPLSFNSAASGIYKIIHEAETGVWHLGGLGEINYVEIAHFIASKLDNFSLNLFNIVEAPNKYIIKASLDCTTTIERTSWFYPSLESVLNSAWNEIF